MTSTAIPATSSSCSPSTINAAQPAATTAATSAASDEMRKNTAIASQTTPPISATGQATTASTPSAVATPLPPRNPSQTGNMSSSIAAPAASSIASVPHRAPISAAATPLPTSQMTVSAANALL